MMNRFCELVGCARPLQQAAMSRVITPALVAAVSNAGGLGMLAVGRSSPDAVIAQIDEVARHTDAPFGAGFLIPYLHRAAFEAVVVRVPIVELFYGWPDAELVRPGTVTGWQVGTVDEAKAAVDVGCRFVVAQGVEAGGHVRATVALAELLPQVRAAVDVPIVAAGGLGTAADVRAAMALGADAVRIGTRLLAADEADIHPVYLQGLIAAGADDTERTDLFEVGWPDAPHRVLASAVQAARRPGPDPVGHMGDVPLPRYGTTPPSSRVTGQIEAMALYAGRSVGAVTRRQPAREIIDELLGGQ